MPRGGETCLYLPRLKEGDDPNAFSRHIRVSYEDLESLFHLSLKDAAREIGLCPTTFKKACRRHHLEKWPSRQKDRDAAIARRNAQTDSVVAAIRTQHHAPVSTPAAPTLQTEAHQAKRAVTVSCTSPVWYAGADAWRHTFGIPFSSIVSSSSSVRPSSELHQDCVKPLEMGPPSSGAVVSSAAPEGLLQLASMALDTRSCGHARYAGPASFPARERSCVEAVMAYLDRGCPISEADVESMLSDDDELQ